MEQLTKEDLVMEMRQASFEEQVYEHFQEICLSSSNAIKFLIEQINQSKQNCKTTYTLQNFLINLHQMSENFTDQIDNVVPLIVSIQRQASANAFASKNNKSLLNVVLDQLIEAIKYSLTLQQMDVTSDDAEININFSQILDNDKSHQADDINESLSLPSIKGNMITSKTKNDSTNSRVLQKGDTNLLSRQQLMSVTPIKNMMIESSQSTLMDSQLVSQSIKSSSKKVSLRLKRPWDKGSSQAGLLSVNYDEQLLQQKLSYQATLQRTEKLLKQHGKCLEMLDKCQYRLRNLKKKLYQIRQVKLPEFNKQLQVIQIKSDQAIIQQNTLTAKVTFCDKTYIKNYLVGQYQVIQQFIGNLRFKQNLNIDYFQQNIEAYNLLKVKQLYILQNIRKRHAYLQVQFKILSVRQNIRYFTVHQWPVVYCHFIINLIYAKICFKYYMQKIKAVRRSQVIKQYFDNTIKKLSSSYNEKVGQYKNLSKKVLHLSYITQISYLQKGYRQYYMYELTQTLQNITKSQYRIIQRISKYSQDNKQLQTINKFIQVFNSKYYYVFQKYVIILQLNVKKDLALKRHIIQFKNRLKYIYFIYNYLLQKIIFQRQKLLMCRYQYLKCKRMLLAKKFYNTQIKVMVMQEKGAK